MVAKIIGWIVYFGCGILFFAIGVYAGKLKKPMWFWSGTEVDASRISDIPAYNKENSAMWKRYSLWYFAAGLAQTWDTILSLILLVAGCTVGMVILVCTYSRIYKKYLH